MLSALNKILTNVTDHITTTTNNNDNPFLTVDKAGYKLQTSSAADLIIEGHQKQLIPRVELIT